MNPQQTGSPNQQTQAPQPTKSKVNPNSTQAALQVAEVRDNLAIMKDGSFRAVIMCRAINFDLISMQEKESVEYAYQGFLNSLEFPIQIVVRSRKVNINTYIDRLAALHSQKSNMLLQKLMEDYLDFVVALAEEASIMDKTFYVVIPFHDTAISKDTVVKGAKGVFKNIFGFRSKQNKVVIDGEALARAKDELFNRVQSVAQGLGNCGVQTVPLDTQGIIELFYDSYNPDTATRQRLDNFEDLTAKIIERQQKSQSPNTSGVGA